MKSIKTLVYAGALVVAGLTTTQAAQINLADYINLSGWTSLGDVGQRDGRGFLTNATSLLPGDDSPNGFFNYSGEDVVSFDNLETLAGVPAGTLDYDPVNSIFAFEGSALRREFAVEAGDFITFDWQLYTNDISGSDFAFVVVDGQFSVLSFSNGLSANGSYGFNKQTGFTTFVSQTFSEAGTVGVTIGVIDAGLDSVSSTALSVVPEPGTWMLLAVTGAVVLCFRRRRRQI